MQALKHIYVRGCYTMEFDATFWFSRYLYARRMVQMTNKVRIVVIEYKQLDTGTLAFK